MTESAVSSFKQNEMTVNIDKFQNIESTKPVKLLGITIDWIHKILNLLNL